MKSKRRMKTGWKARKEGVRLGKRGNIKRRRIGKQISRKEKRK